ncbi:MAG TPA: hypothetical protein VFJ74_01280 [Gemmatimonadaceae bacterium]|nr:hypothetical protein [Gemmatimonadaceae bacterium]
MSSPGLLDFFILEASEYVEQLDGLVGAAGDTGPEAGEFARVARALRGSATMARAAGIAELAGGIERAARALRDGTLWWDAALKGALTSAVDDLKILLRALRTWGAGEDARVRARVAELSGFAPPWRGGSPTPPLGNAVVSEGDAAPSAGAAPAPVNDGAARYLATAAAGIVVALADLAANPSSRDALANVLGRVRALRGVAAVRDLPPLGDVVEAIERATKPLELGQADATPEQQAVLAAAGEVLRRVSDDVLAGRRPDPNASDVVRLAGAAAALDDATEETDSDRVVPIAELFFADGGAHVVARAANPPTTPAERFRLEVVSQAEHLRRLVADARRATGNGAPGRDEAVRRALRHALRALEDAAHGFGENEVAGFVAAYRDAVVALDAPALGALDEVAALLADPTTQSGELARRLGELSRARTASGAVPRQTDAAGVVAIESLAPDAGAAASRGRSPTPTGRHLHALLESSIAGINQLEHAPLAQRTPIAEEAVDAGAVVPIESLEYRGQAALSRARELRDTLQRGLTSVAPGDRAALDELLALIELAATGD